MRGRYISQSKAHIGFQILYSVAQYHGEVQGILRSGKEYSMTQSLLFGCKNCGRDTLTQAHAISCPVYKEEMERQTILQCKALGIPFERSLFGIPPPLGDP